MKLYISYVNYFFIQYAQINMTGTLAQLIALVAYGNQCIAYPGAHKEFVLRHSTFQFCEKVFFYDRKEKILFF